MAAARGGLDPLPRHRWSQNLYVILSNQSLDGFANLGHREVRFQVMNDVRDLLDRQLHLRRFRVPFNVNDCREQLERLRPLTPELGYDAFYCSLILLHELLGVLTKRTPFASRRDLVTAHTVVRASSARPAGALAALATSACR
jgi:hypothetical protein